MTHESKNAKKTALRTATIPRTRKEKCLQELSEEDFRDKLVRPLFLRRGFTYGSETCGPDEEGKDTVLLTKNQLGMLEVWVIQTKKGKLNLASKARQNVITAAVQLQTAFEH